MSMSERNQTYKVFEDITEYIRNKYPQYTVRSRDFDGDCAYDIYRREIYSLDNLNYLMVQVRAYINPVTRPYDVTVVKNGTTISHTSYLNNALTTEDIDIMFNLLTSEN